MNSEDNHPRVQLFDSPKGLQFKGHYFENEQGVRIFVDMDTSNVCRECNKKVRPDLAMRGYELNNTHMQIFPLCLGCALEHENSSESSNDPELLEILTRSAEALEDIRSSEADAGIEHERVTASLSHSAAHSVDQYLTAFAGLNPQIGRALNRLLDELSIQPGGRPKSYEEVRKINTDIGEVIKSAITAAASEMALRGSISSVPGTVGGAVSAIINQDRNAFEAAVDEIKSDLGVKNIGANPESYEDVNRNFRLTLVKSIEPSSRATHDVSDEDFLATILGSIIKNYTAKREDSIVFAPRSGKFFVNVGSDIIQLMRADRLVAPLLQRTGLLVEVAGGRSWASDSERFVEALSKISGMELRKWVSGGGSGSKILTTVGINEPIPVSASQLKHERNIAERQAIKAERRRKNLAAAAQNQQARDKDKKERAEKRKLLQAEAEAAKAKRKEARRAKQAEKRAEAQSEREAEKKAKKAKREEANEAKELQRRLDRAKRADASANRRAERLSNKLRKDLKRKGVLKLI
ncbi:MAG: hypothetical protein EOO02_01890 [Chitinophagaceae bacterium]|nr:MAG: hypothetical protein EOO02_01890 [Chitinophagaceae bacterium]